MGFKHVGKSTLGKALAKASHLPFVDLDQKIEQNYSKENGVQYSCREIFQNHGEDFFRAYENKILQQLLAQPRSIIALGGGAPLSKENKKLLQSQCLLYITADPEIVFNRIMNHGKPAFFPAEQDPHDFFLQMWRQREVVYKQLASYTFDNTDSVAQTVQEIMKKLESENELCNH